MGENVQSKKSTKIQFNNKNPNHTKLWKKTSQVFKAELQTH